LVRAAGELFVFSWLGQANAWYQVFGSH